MGAIRILLVALAGVHLFGCVLIDWLPIRYEPLPPFALPESVAKPSSAPDEPPKRTLPKTPAPEEKNTAVQPRKTTPREAVSTPRRDGASKENSWAAAAEDPEAEYSQGILYLSGVGVERDYVRARDLFLAAAQRGHAGALRALGQMYENGLGMPPAPGEASKWYGLAAGHGEIRAMGALGYLVFTGFGIQQNTEVGLLWLRMAGEQGHVESQLLLGAIHDAGWFVEENDTEALKWYALAAERGDPLARFMQASMHALGESVPLDLVRAARDYRIAAAMGLGEAQAVLDNRYINLSGDEAGLRWKQDLVERRPRYAREHMEKFSRLVETFKGAALGDADRMFALGSLYWRGEGLEKDFTEAMRWWGLAARLGSERARECLAKIDDFEKNGASHRESPMTRVGKKRLPSVLVTEIGFDLLGSGENFGAIRPSSAWMNMLRRSRDHTLPTMVSRMQEGIRSAPE